MLQKEQPTKKQKQDGISVQDTTVCWPGCRALTADFAQPSAVRSSTGMLPRTRGIFALSGGGLRATAEVLQLLVGLHSIQKGEYLRSSYNVKKFLKHKL